MSTADSDEELVVRGRGGDAAARRLLIERHVDTVFRLAYRMARTRPEAEDLAQEVLAGMLEYRQGWLSALSFRVWIKRAVLNRVIDESRRRKRWGFVRPLEDGMDFEDSRADAEASLGTSETKATVERAVRALPDRQRAVIILCHYENLSLTEAAQTMKSSVGAVEQLLHRAKASLRVRLKSMVSDDASSWRT